MIREERFKQLEDRITELSERLEEFGRDLGESVDERFRGVKHRTPGRIRGESFMGFVLILAGLIWLGNKMNWYYFNIPFWPALLIVLGVYVLISSGRK